MTEQKSKKSKKQTVLLIYCPAKQPVLSVVVGVLLFFISACSSDKDRNIPNIENVRVSISVNRFEQAVFKIDTNNIGEAYKQLEKSYPVFTEIFFRRMLRGSALRDSSEYQQFVRGFVTYPPLRKLNDTVQIAYPDLKFLEKELSQAFSYLRYYLPKQPLPAVYTFVSEYTNDIVLGDSLVGIGLDWFLGDGHLPYYSPELATPLWLARTLNKEYITVNVVQAIAEDLVGPPASGQMIDHLLRNGKVWYIVDLLLPETPDSIKTGFTREQLNFCEKGEGGLYRLLAKENLFYSNNMQDWRRFITPGPFDIEHPTDLPGNSGSWLGWKIIAAYARKTKASLPDILQQRDAQVLLKAYKAPRR